MEEHWIYEDSERKRRNPLYGILLFLVVMASFFKKFKLSIDE